MADDELRLPARAAKAAKRAEPQAPPKPAEGLIRFRVSGGTRTIGHGQAVYAVDPAGWVDLPAGETWYADLVGNGTLASD